MAAAAAVAVAVVVAAAVVVVAVAAAVVAAAGWNDPSRRRGLAFLEVAMWSYSRPCDCLFELLLHSLPYDGSLTFPESRRRWRVADRWLVSSD